MKGEKKQKKIIVFVVIVVVLEEQKNFIEHERMSKQGKLLMLLLNDGQINSKVWDVVHFIESGN